MIHHRFEQLKTAVPAEALSQGSFAALPVMFAAAPGASSASAPSIYEVAREAALRQMREQEFRRFVDRALFSCLN